MKKSLLIMIAIIILWQTAAANLIENGDWRYSIRIPDTYKEINANQIENEYAKIVLGNLSNKEGFMLLFHVAQKRKLQEGQTIFEWKDGENSAYFVFNGETIGDPHAAIATECGREETLTGNNQWSAYFQKLKQIQMDLDSYESEKRWRYEKSRKAFHDKERHAIKIESLYFDNNVPLLSACRFYILGSNRMVTITGCCCGPDAANFMTEAFEPALETFAFDENYGFGESTAGKTLGTLRSWLVPSFISLLLFAGLYKWINP